MIHSIRNLPPRDSPKEQDIAMLLCHNSTPLVLDLLTQTRHFSTSNFPLRYYNSPSSSPRYPILL